jgi:hypothetical protein
MIASDPETGEALTVVPVEQDGDPVDPGEAGATHDAHVITVAASGRDPSAATLTGGEYVVSWVNEDGRVQATMLEPSTTTDEHGASHTAYRPASIDLSDISGAYAVASDQDQEVTALDDGSFVLVWVTTDPDGGLDIVGRLFVHTEEGAWAPSDAEVFIRDVNTSHSGERIEFTVSPERRGDDGFEIVIHTDDDHAGQSQAAPLDNADGDAGLAVLGGDTLTFAPEFIQPADPLDASAHTSAADDTPSSFADDGSQLVAAVAIPILPEAFTTAFEHRDGQDVYHILVT